MADLLQQLENNEAVLLLYLADELSSEDRTEVEQMLKSDPSLRADLESMRSMVAATDGLISKLDEADAETGLKEAAARQTLRAMRQWRVDQLARAAPPPPPTVESRRAWWVYPIATAVALMLGFVIWWGIVPDSSPSGGSFGEGSTSQWPIEVSEGVLPDAPDVDDSAQQRRAERLAWSFSASESEFQPAMNQNYVSTEVELQENAVASDDISGIFFNQILYP